MRKILLATFLALSVAGQAIAQSSKDVSSQLNYKVAERDIISRIGITPYMPKTIAGLSDNNCRLLEGRLRTMLSRNDVLSDYGDSRFVLTAAVSELEKEVLNTAPTQVVCKYEVSLGIGDGVDGIEFSSTMIELKGVGKNEERALANALKRLSADNKAVVEMIKSASIKIIDYYNAKGMALLAQAETLAATGNYEEALYILLTIPSECNVYTEAIEKAQAIYQKYSDNKCTQLLSEAEAAWAANPTPENAEAVVSKLTGISPDASNYAQVQAFINKVGNAVKSEIEYERKKEDEAIAYERQKEQQALERRHQMELQALKAARDVAKAYAENQPDINYHIW